MPSVLSKQEQIQQLVDSSSILQRISNYYTHVDRHKHVDDVSYLERIFQEKSANSAFTDNLDVNAVLGEMLYYRAQDIAKWLDTADIGDKQAFYVGFEEDDFGQIGTGLIRDRKTGLIKEYSSNDVCMVLRKDTSSLGFTLVTAYPYMEAPTVTPTNRNLKEITVKTDTFKKASDVKKAYLLYTTSWQSSMSISYKAGDEPRDDALYLYLPTDNPNTTDVVKLKAHTTLLKSISEDPVTGVSHPIETIYHTIRDASHPEHRGKPGVLLEDADVRAEFAKHHPQADKEISYLQRHIQQFESERFARYRKRMEMANNIMRQSSNDNPEYQLE